MPADEERSQEALWRGYDKAGLDAQLNNRERVPEHPRHIARWQAESARVRETLGGAPGTRLDLPYGDTAGQRLDLFTPGGEIGAGGEALPPLVAFIHGGYWQALDKGDFSYLAPAFLEAGVAFASVNYDLCPQVSIEEIVRQTRTALAFLAREGGGGLGFDPKRIIVAGHSAGGHLVATAMTCDWKGLYGLAASPIRGGCSISGLYELEPLMLCYQQGVLQLDPGQVERCSPQRHRPPEGMAAPLICAVGGEESDEFLDQQSDFVAAWRADGLEVEEIALPGLDHFTAVDAFGQAGHALHEGVRRMALSH